MNWKLTFMSLVILGGAFEAAQATPVLTVGQPGDSQFATPSKPTSLGSGSTLINFDSLTPYTSYTSTYSASGVSISSPDGLVVDPYSTQSGPNYLYDNSADGSANLTILLANSVYGIGIGVADSDPVTVLIQTLGLGGVNLGSAFSVYLPSTESSVNTGNGYYLVTDKTNDIYGLKITQSTGNANYSGLAVDDLQLQPVPEPSSITLLAEALAGIGALGSFRKLRRS